MRALMSHNDDALGSSVTSIDPPDIHDLRAMDTYRFRPYNYATVMLDSLISGCSHESIGHVITALIVACFC